MFSKCKNKCFLQLVSLSYTHFFMWKNVEKFHRFVIDFVSLFYRLTSRVSHILMKNLDRFHRFYRVSIDSLSFVIDFFIEWYRGWRRRNRGFSSFTSTNTDQSILAICEHLPEEPNQSFHSSVHIERIWTRFLPCIRNQGMCL